MASHFWPQALVLKTEGRNKQQISPQQNPTQKDSRWWEDSTDRWHYNCYELRYIQKLLPHPWLARNDCVSQSASMTGLHTDPPQSMQKHMQITPRRLFSKENTLANSGAAPEKVFGAMHSHLPPGISKQSNFASAPPWTWTLPVILIPWGHSSTGRVLLHCTAGEGYLWHGQWKGNNINTVLSSQILLNVNILQEKGFNLPP